MEKYRDVIDEISSARAGGEAFALATVVRTVSLTAAKPGAKAIIKADGTISAGWIGGGCARAAVLKAAREALADGKPRLISVQPGDALREIGRVPGEVAEGTQYARNMCPSQGTMDVFIEPYPMRFELIICGATPVAVALADLARRMGLRVIVAADVAEHHRFSGVDGLIETFDIPATEPAERYIVVATQGRGDEAALTGAVTVPSRYVAFVGSHKKARALKEALVGKGIEPRCLEGLHAPAGLDLGAVTPEEIAVSILGEITSVRRRGQRQSLDANEKISAAE